MNIGRGQIRGTFFNFFVVKKYPFCIFRTLPSVSEITPGNDLNISIKNSRAYHFADDTNIMLSNDHLSYEQKKMNQDQKNLSQWLKANKLSLNVKMTELIIFHPRKTKLDYSVKFKLNGRRLNPISTVKYLGVLLDEHWLWTKQVNWVNSKLNQIIGILSKLRYNTSSPILKIFYHSLFGLYLQYGAQL